MLKYRFLYNPIPTTCAEIFLSRSYVARQGDLTISRSTSFRAPGAIMLMGSYHSRSCATIIPFVAR
jgi:hypothetical protein